MHSACAYQRIAIGKGLNKKLLRELSLQKDMHHDIMHATISLLLAETGLRYSYRDQIDDDKQGEQCKPTAHALQRHADTRYDVHWLAKRQRHINVSGRQQTPAHTSVKGRSRSASD